MFLKIVICFFFLYQEVSGATADFTEAEKRSYKKSKEQQKLPTRSDQEKFHAPNFSSDVGVKNQDHEANLDKGTVPYSRNVILEDSELKDLPVDIFVGWQNDLIKDDETCTTHKECDSKTNVSEILSTEK